MKMMLAIFLGALFVSFSFWRRWLTLSGAIAAFFLGLLYFGIGTFPWYGLLLFFFITSSLLTQRKDEKRIMLEQDYEKGGTRDAGQVLANGGVGAGIILLTLFFPSYELYLYLAFAGVMATVTADTWATELGCLSRTPPVHILTGRRVPAGESGGISLFGTLMSILGSALIALLAVLSLLLTDKIHYSPFRLLYLLIIITLAGSMGALIDSLLGATLQRMNRCPHCGKEVEAAIHCGKATHHTRGIPWFTNDVVNLSASIGGGFVSFCLAFFS